MAITDSAPRPATFNESAVMLGNGRLEMQETDMPTPEYGEILVQIRSVGVCGSDVHFFEHGRIGLDVIKPPHVLGHEVSGVVVGHGPAAAGPPLGTLVALEPSRPCNTCRLCRSGQYNLCPEMRYLSAPGAAGAFTRFLTIPQEFAYPVPAGVSADTAALIEPLAVVVHAARRAGISAGTEVLISGAGPIGLLMIQVAHASGATSVVITDVNQSRLDRAARLGASATVNVGQQALEDLELEVDVFVECSGQMAALSSGIPCVRAGGVVSVVGMSPTSEATIPLALMQAREITLIPNFRFANAYESAIRLVAAGKVQPEAIITGHFGLPQTLQALQASRADPRAVKTIVRVHP